ILTPIPRASRSPPPRWPPSPSNVTRSMASGTTPSHPTSSRHEAVIPRQILRAGAFVLDRGALLPLGHRLRVDPVPSGQHPQALLTLLDRSTHCRRRAGAPMQNLAHSASFHSKEKSAPSNPVTKYLACALQDAF